METQFTESNGSSSKFLDIDASKPITERFIDIRQAPWKFVDLTWEEMKRGIPVGLIRCPSYFK
jgi:hypothetical protein